MLTGELVRYQIEGDTIRPRFITKRHATKYLVDAENLIRILRNHIGQPQSKLVEALYAYEGRRTDFKILRGLSKLLLEDAEFSPALPIDYGAFRQSLFSYVQKYYPVLTRKDLLHDCTRKDVLESLSTEIGISAEEIIERMYGDLPENQVLSAFKSKWDEAGLLRRYNLALAQGVLYRSVWMKIRLMSDYRIVFQYLKLAGLMHWIHPIESGGYEIDITGPGSLLMQTQRYGVRMAVFLPGLILAKDWQMYAEIQTQQGPKQFVLDHHRGLTSHYKTRPPFDSAIEQNFYEKFARKTRNWSIEREGALIDLGDTVFIPDFTFRHENGRTAYMEVVGYWTPEYLKKKIEKLNQYKRDNLILAVNSQLNCSRDDFQADVIPYRTGIKLNTVLEALDNLTDQQTPAGS